MLPQGYSVRAPEPADVAAVARVLHAYQIAVFGEPDDTEDDIREWWARPNFDLSRDAWIVTGPDGAPAAYAYSWTKSPGESWIEAWVNPRHGGCGIEEFLLDEAEARAAEACPNGTIISPIGTVETGVVAMLISRGYHPTRHDWRMRIDIDPGFPAPPPPLGIDIREMDPAHDARAMHETMNEAFRCDGQFTKVFEDWCRMSFEDSRFDPSLCFVALDGDVMAGASFSIDVVDHGWVRTLAVLEPWRRRGIGRALLLRSFAAFAARGRTGVMLGVDSHNPTGATHLYESVGMRVVREFDFYEKESEEAG